MVLVSTEVELTMDWMTGTHDHRPAPRAEPPGPTLLEAAWQATSPSGKVLTCALYRGVEGCVEVRAEYPNHDLIRSELARDVVTARQTAAGWKDAAMAKASPSSSGPADGDFSGVRNTSESFLPRRQKQGEVRMNAQQEHERPIGDPPDEDDRDGEDEDDDENDDEPKDEEEEED
jgi:hypothetical protein